MDGVELEAVEVEFDGAPRVRTDQVAEILGELRFGEIVDLLGEIPAQAPDGAGVSVDGLGLQPLEFEVLEMQLVLPVKVAGRSVRHGVQSKVWVEFRLKRPIYPNTDAIRHWLG